jgi:5-methylcytosine-specific restriction endonuclease McrA
MKRTGFRKKTLEEVKEKQKEKKEKDKLKPKVAMKKTPLAKRGKSEQSKLERKLWQVCREYASYLYDDTKCFTCDKPVEGRNRQLGHFIPKATCGANLKYNIDNLRWQCYHCNINMGGAGAEFYRRLVNERGQEYVDFLFMLKNNPVTIKAFDYYKMQIELYKKNIEDFKKHYEEYK